ncbi:uncharacterized protein LOC113377981 [Ctenocephalides felis]|uniref:uncharacterized protein LOC113377981 n=1 Tax=Ctenocephalides felis TaxID=7515 RepID=UPI000E6E59BB|nr:uncharacterized protein LOC113377981 [Ctenocephalides felis]
MADLSTLLQQRSQIEITFDIIFKYVTSFKGDNIAGLNIRKQKLLEMFHRIEEIYVELELLEPKKYSVEFRKYCEKHLDLLTRIDELVQDNTVDNKQAIDNIIKPNNPQVKLPDIVLPRFNGEYNSWVEFKDIFISLIHNNKNLTDVEKLYYLKGSLSSGPSKLIANLTMTNQNYAIAWNSLTQHYDNKLFIINAHLSSLFNLPNLTRDTFEHLNSFLNTARQQVLSLKSVYDDAKYWDLVFIFLFTKKLDDKTCLAWNLHRNTDLPTLEQFFEFLTSRISALEATFRSEPSSSKSKFNSKPVNFISKQKSKRICPFCKRNHPLFNCDAFKKLSVQERKKFANKNNCCEKCLDGFHALASCKYTGSCRVCKSELHNTLLHSAQSDQISHQVDKPSDKPPTILLANCKNNIQTLLSTAIVRVYDSFGRSFNVRALLDSGSQINIISESLADRLNCTLNTVSNSLSVLHGHSLFSNKTATIKIFSNASTFSRTLDFVVLKSITSNLPSADININDWNIPSHIKLADPHFYISSPIDMLIGAELFFDILQQGSIRLGSYHPILRNSKFGWIVSGNYNSVERSKEYVGLITHSNFKLNENLVKFWNLEEIPETNMRLYGLNKICEEQFLSSVSRINNRFEVALPFTPDYQGELGHSYGVAHKRFLYLEKRFYKNPNLYKLYREFIHEYISMGHAVQTDIPKSDILDTFDSSTSHNHYYMPHHAVFKNSDSNKIRVVFDASTKTSSGKSLNDILLAGPKLQKDLFCILLRFRSKPFVFIADLIKMFRQINIKRADQEYQRILWRDSPSEEIRCYRLTTVTYGTASAPYLAIRCLNHLAFEEKATFPIASHVLLEDIYVDDIITGANSIEHLQRTKIELIKLLELGGFCLHKWASNIPSFLNDIPLQLREFNNPIFTDDKNSINTLGLLWNPKQDHFLISVPTFKFNNCTKRVILSVISQIFDPLGLIAPVVIQGKLILQELWKDKKDWDESVSANVENKWFKFATKLGTLSHLVIDRCVFHHKRIISIQLHGFADASSYAYGACFYVKTTYEDKTTSVKLLCAKSKVAPLKPITLARLELCAALLLARLFRRVIDNIDINFEKVLLWSDSNIVLSWIAGDPNRWHIFVSNRVGEITDITPGTIWRHVPSDFNPADLISRGLSADQLKTCELWWNGPSWLSENTDRWPNVDPSLDAVLPEQRVLLVKENSSSFLDTFCQRFSSLRKMTRVLAYCLRMNPCIKRSIGRGDHNTLSVPELDNALKVILKLVQLETFTKVIKNLQDSKHTPSLKLMSELKSLHPFLDKSGFLRVGGRIENADVSYEQKHPIILPKKHYVTRLLLKQEHERLMHAGTQTVLANIRRKYWPLNARRELKAIIHSCVKCAKIKAVTASQLMGSLPIDRVKFQRPFLMLGLITQDR